MKTLSKRELEVLNLICRGYTDVEIGDILKISDRTVGSHRRNLITKLEATNTPEMVFIAMSEGLLEGKSRPVRPLPNLDGITIEIRGKSYELKLVK